MEILGKYPPEEYASFWGCDPVYDKPPRLPGDGYLFYNHGSEQHTKESLTKLLAAIDRTIEQVKMRSIQDDIDVAAKEDKEDIQGLSELKDHVQSLLVYQNQKNTRLCVICNKNRIPLKEPSQYGTQVVICSECQRHKHWPI